MSSVEDMIHLTELTEESILENLRLRYQEKFIYTYTGSILVAMNPFQKLDIYNQVCQLEEKLTMIQKFISQYTNKRLADNQPHIFAIAETSVANIKNFRVNQAVIISGESGAGKTESTKVILQYLTAVTSQSGDNSKSWVEQQILEANTILESFGNAKTVRNNNSSRFGKFVQILFNRNVNIIGASIVNYLLEKSRVVRQAKTERNYHVFYELMAGASASDRQNYKLLKGADQYAYLNKSGCIEIPGTNDGKNFESLKLALQVLKMGSSDIDAIFRIVSAILYLGNVPFSSVNDVAAITETGLVKTIAELLSCDEQKLAQALVSRRLTVRNESTLVPLKIEQANDNRDSLAKTLYDRMFNFIVEFINKSTATSEQPDCFIGVLDIFGFELFEINSFEQLCINYTNEKLQQFFNQFIFKLEMEEYKKEGVPIEDITYKDNQLCIDLIESKAGVLAMLDEECKVPKGSDETFLQKIAEMFGKNEYFIKPRTAKGCFGIKHYAGEVIYQVSGFLDKNRDAVQDEVSELFQESRLSTVQKMFKRQDSTVVAQAGQKKAVTAGSNFKGQLVSLVTTLGATTPHYVRCLKPNWEKKAFVFDANLTVAQLRYAGMLETIRIRKVGFPIRFSYEVAIQKFRYLLSGQNKDLKASSLSIVKNAKVDNMYYRCGTTKLFLKQEALDQIIVANDILKTKMVIVVQKLWRAFICRKRFLEKKKAAQFLQTYARGFVYRKRYVRIRKSIIIIQSGVRGWFARDYLRQLKAEKRAREAEERRQRLAEEERVRQVEEQRLYEETLAQNAAMEESERRALAQQFANAEVVRNEQKKRDEQQLEEEMRLLQIAAQKQQVKEEQKQTIEVRPKVQANLAVASVLQKPEIVAEDVNDVDALFSFLDDFGEGSAPKPQANSDVAAMLVQDMDDLFKLKDVDLQSVKDEPKKKAIVSSQNDVTEVVPGVEPNLAGVNGSANLLSSEIKAPQVAQEDFSVILGVSTEPKTTKLKSNPLARAADVVEKQKFYPMLAFAQNCFNQHTEYNPTSTISRMMKKKENSKQIEFSQMLVFTRNPIPLSMTVIENSSLSNLAIECFKMLQKYQDPNNKRGMDDVSILKRLIELAIDNADLRDELYVQLCRQITPSAESATLKNFDSWLLNGWVLMAHYCQSFPPSKNFTKYLQQFLTQNALSTQEMKNQVPKLAQLCEVSIKKVLINGARKFGPSTKELAAVSNLSNLIVNIQLMDGQNMTFPLAFTVSASEAIKELAARIKISDMTGWSLCEVAENPYEERSLKATDYLADYYSLQEHEPPKIPEVKITSVGTQRQRGMSAASQTQPVIAQIDVNKMKRLAGSNVKIFFKKRLFRNPYEIPVNPVEFNLFFAQHFADYLHDMYPVNDQLAAQIAAMKAQINFNDYQPNIYAKIELSLYLPASSIPKIPVADWVKEIQAVHQKLVGRNSTQARLQILEALKQFRHFGSTVYPAKYKGFWQHPENVHLAVHANYVLILLKNKTVVDMFPYNCIQGWEADHETITLHIQRFATAPGKENEAEVEVFSFITRSPEEVSMLMKEYSSKSGVKKDRDLFISEAELQPLVRDLEKSRTNLVKKKLVNFSVKRNRNPDISKIFGHGEVSAPAENVIPDLTQVELSKLLKEWKVAIQSLGAPLLTTYPQESDAYNAAIRMVTLLTEAANSLQYQQGPTSNNIASSGMNLSVVSNRTLFGTISSNNQLATKGLSNMQLAPGSYKTLASKDGKVSGAPEIQGTVHRNSVSAHPEWVQIGRIIHRCFEEPALIDELYMQLIKLTTEFSEPDGNIVLIYWKIFAVACGCLKPKISEVTDLLRAHLRRYQVIDQSAQPSSMRKVEATYAKYCGKMMVKCMTSDIRKVPPGQAELQAVAQLKPVYHRVYLADGQYRAIGFSPHSTVKEVFNIVAQKLKISAEQGFALYAVGTGNNRTSRPLEVRQQMCDIIGQWDKEMKRTGAKEALFNVTLRRRLYPNPQNPAISEIEEELMAHQFMNDIVNGIYPLSSDDAAMIAAFKCQAENGDEHPERKLDYQAVVDKYVPPHMRTPSSKVEIQREHSSLRRRTAVDCRRLLLTRLRTWPLFGATIFEVAQNYTSDLPQKLWLLINQQGIYISDVNSKTPLIAMRFSEVAQLAPDQNSLMIVTNGRQTKYVFQSTEAVQIVELMTDYQRMR